MDTNTIYVGIPSMCDPLLEYTIRNCFGNADHPENITMSVIEQEYPEHALDWTNPQVAQWKKQIHYKLYHPTDSRGCSWARSLAQRAYTDQKYYLQIDSHTGFEKGWDTTYINAMEELMQYHDKPIISCYPESMVARDDDPIKNPLPDTFEPVGANNTIVMLVGAGDVKKNSKGKLVYQGKAHEEFQKQPDNYIWFFGSDHLYDAKQPYAHGFGFSGGGTFTLGSFITEVPWDEKTYFSGEEQLAVVKAWTRGWNVFHRRGGYPIRHYYAPEYKAHNNHWSGNHKLKTSWTDLADYGKARQKAVYTGEVQGEYGLGTARTLKDFAKWSGIDLERKLLKPIAFGKENPIYEFDWTKDPMEYLHGSDS